jgi:hypothetical protein
MDAMKQKTAAFLGVLGVCLGSFMAVFSCATSGGSAGGASTLDEAIRASAERLGADLAGKKAAVVAFGSPSRALSEYVIEELSLALVNGRAVTVVDRRELDLVREELQFSLSGEVSDESAQRIGNMLGAQAVVSGSLVDAGGGAYRFRVKAINTESAAVESAPAFDVGRRDERLVYLLGGARAAQPGTAPAAQPGTAPAPQTGPAAQTGRRILPADLAEVFGANGVAATFNAVHDFLQTCDNGNAEGRRERIAQRVMLGDWIDLPRLTVRGDAGGGAIDTDNVDLGGNGKLLRLIVVGIDSFAATNRDAPAHVVFQFQNVPGSHRMNATDTNAGGYRGSGMRVYLANNFLRGLIAAGVPERVLYAPVRRIANGGPGASAADALTDWLWLPTEREVFGGRAWSNTTWETAANQARLEYYEGDGQRVKYNKSGAMWWWEASPSSGSAAYFCAVAANGYANYHYASAVGGCAPAFCVR